MRLTYLASLLIQASLFHTVLSAPAPDVLERGLVKRYTGTPAGKKGSGGPATSDYNTDDEIRQAYTNPDNRPSVFYSMIPRTSGGSNIAAEFADEVKGLIYSQVFETGYTRMKGRSFEWYQNFADRFSGVFAEKASGTAYLVAPWETIIDPCSVWQRIENGTLFDNHAVDLLVLVDYKDFKRQAVGWERSGRSAPRVKSRGGDLLFAKRQSTGTCFDWEGDGENPNDR